MPRVIYLAPTHAGVGLTSISLGLVRALDRLSLKVGFLKPISQSQDAKEVERSSLFIREMTPCEPPMPLGLERAEELLRQDRNAQLQEEIVGRYQEILRNTPDVDVIIVEGLVPTLSASYADTLNVDIVQTLDAQVILVTASRQQNVNNIQERLDMTARLFGGASAARVLGAIINKLGAPYYDELQDEDVFPEIPSKHDIIEAVPIFQKDNFQLLGAVPYDRNLMAARVSDVAAFLGTQVVHAGEMQTRRVKDVALCASGVVNVVPALKPHTLVVTPADRNDVIIASAMAALNGVPLAGILLGSGYPLDTRVHKMCEAAFATGLPLLLVHGDSYHTAARIANMSNAVPSDDLERINKVMNSVADAIDSTWLQNSLKTTKKSRLSPAAFFYQLVQKAQKANKRIVLPEGNEPRTVKAAARCAERGIARTVLLAPRDEVLRVAEAQGVTLGDAVEILEPTEEVRERYVARMVELRGHKGMTAGIARDQLQDTVVLGTMMLEAGEVDGLVSGAVHTTANTVRPAFRYIKTKADAKLVSSIFFMCLPEQVRVFGDCAIVPNPSPEELADIALQSAISAQSFGIEARVAMISYSTGSSGTGEDVDKVRAATKIAQERAKAEGLDMLIDGPMQYDAAAVASVAKKKAPDSPVAGQANVFIFPDLNTGNTTYKAVQRSANVVSVGPMLQGLNKPVNDLSRGALVDDIVYTIALTAIQAV